MTIDFVHSLVVPDVPGINFEFFTL